LAASAFDMNYNDHKMHVQRNDANDLSSRSKDCAQALVCCMDVENHVFCKKTDRTKHCSGWKWTEWLSTRFDAGHVWCQHYPARQFWCQKM